jgi:hypothetical protein
MKHGGERRRFESDAADVEYRGSRLEPIDSEITAIGRDGVYAIGSRERDLRADESGTGTVYHSADQDSWERVAVK